MGKLYAVKMKIHNAPGSVGFHSVWYSEDEANRQASLRNKYNGDFAEYFVEEKTEFTRVTNGFGRPQVRFADSVGWMEIK